MRIKTGQLGARAKADLFEEFFPGVSVNPEDNEAMQATLDYINGEIAEVTGVRTLGGGRASFTTSDWNDLQSRYRGGERAGKTQAKTPVTPPVVPPVGGAPDRAKDDPLNVLP